eukprot:2501165-Pyramimonas_sp.AAC.1
MLSDDGMRQVVRGILFRRLGTRTRRQQIAPGSAPSGTWFDRRSFVRPVGGSWRKPPRRTPIGTPRSTKDDGFRLAPGSHIWKENLRALARPLGWARVGSSPVAVWGAMRNRL